MRLDPPTSSGTTVVDPPRRSTASGSLALGSSSGSTASLTTATSPHQALLRDEMVRTRKFSYAGILVALAAASALSVLPGEYVTTRIFACAIACSVVGHFYLIYRTRDPATFHNSVAVAIGWCSPVLAVASAIPYFGPFSPITIVPVFGIYFTSLGQNLVLAASIYTTYALTQAVCAVLIITRVADMGMIHPDQLSTTAQILLEGLIQLVLATTFAVARSSRRSSLIAIGELEQATRVIAQREALLQEARQELQRALGAGRGRFTAQVIGAYQLGDLIGRGGMGEVYEAVDTRTQRVVAIKMLGATSLGNASHVQRFLRELRTAAALDSPNIVRVLDVGEDPLPHLVMERLHGRDLAALVRERPMAPAAFLDMLRQVGAGITVAGAAGVVHRDLKPQNVFLDGATWKILDFGVSRLTDASDTLTAGNLVGTPTYMAPEQARGEPVDHRADLYALAAIAYRVLTGHPPFASGELADMLYRVVHAAPRRPTSLAKLPDDVDLALAIGLAKDRTQRFATAGELTDAIAAALDGALPDELRLRGHLLVARGVWGDEVVTCS
ncbi:MAG TPA: serine/threonine-protein kinase [Kofleriaceae bacterium]|nr:serine/threonine-protein kinase [Kofleriaceae bacterium]